MRFVYFFYLLELVERLVLGGDEGFGLEKRWRDQGGWGCGRFGVFCIFGIFGILGILTVLIFLAVLILLTILTIFAILSILTIRPL
jgi:hypothetical protein